MIKTSIVKFFEIDLTSVGGDVLYFHPGFNEFDQPVVWGGRTYQPFPIEIEGLGTDGRGRSVRPTLMVSNLTGQLGALVKTYKDLNGCKLTMRSTFALYVDAVNFVDGNPDANPLLEFPREVWFFERKVEETHTHIKFELASALDLEGQALPGRVFNANYCSHQYKGELCNYSGTSYFDAADNPVGSSAQDVCGHRLSSCMLRFGENNEL